MAAQRATEAEQRESNYLSDTVDDKPEEAWNKHRGQPGRDPWTTSPTALDGALD